MDIKKCDLCKKTIKDKAVYASIEVLAKE